MGFTLQLAQDLVEVEAGGNSPVTIIVSNRGDASDRFELDIEGLDGDWKAIPVPVFTAEAGESRTERAFFKPPRASESGAGNYPFVVRVRSLTTGEEKTVQGVLRVKPFHSLTLEISPKKGLHSWSTHRNRFEISVTNLGNTEHTLQLVGSDPEDACTYEFEQERVTIAPGQQKEVAVEVRPVSSPLLSGSKLIGFSVHARSADVPSVVASGQAQLERRSLLSPANLTLLIILLLMISAWYVMKPKPPGVELQINPMQGLPGDKVTVSWVAHDADRVTITATDSKSSTVVYDGTDLASSATWNLSLIPGSETFTAKVSKGANHPAPVAKLVKIDTPAPLVTPKILSFAPAPPFSENSKELRVKIPGQVVFNWQVDGAVKVALNPDYPDLDPNLVLSQAITVDTVGDKFVQLVAKSKDGVTVRSAKTYHIVGYDESDAKVVNFTAFPLTVQTGGVVTLTWNVVNATLVKLKHDGIEESPLVASDTKSFTITRDTTFILEAYDAKSRMAAPKKITVKLQPPPEPNPTTAGPNEGTGQTTGVTPSTPPSTAGTDSGPATTGR